MPASGRLAKKYIELFGSVDHFPFHRQESPLWVNKPVLCGSGVDRMGAGTLSSCPATGVASQLVSSGASVHVSKSQCIPVSSGLGSLSGVAWNPGNVHLGLLVSNGQFFIKPPVSKVQSAGVTFQLPQGRDVGTALCQVSPSTICGLLQASWTFDVLGLRFPASEASRRRDTWWCTS